ncbi:MAG: DUF4296 domain-containing protein [Chitinophagales bacterium]
MALFRFMFLQNYSIVLFISLLFILFSCEKKSQVALPTVPEDKMVEVLALLYVNEVKAVKTYDLQLQKDEYLKKYLYPAIFDSLDVVDSLFYQSYEYYDADPATLQALMGKVVERLEQMTVDTVKVVTEEGRSLEEAYEEIIELEKFKQDNSSEKAKKRFQER